MLKTLRYGFIGCGMMGQEHLRNLAMIKGTEVIAIYEPDAAMRSESARLAPKARFTESEEEVIRAEDVDALVITSPNYLHARQLEHISAIRPMPVLVEKPVCTSLEQLRALQVWRKITPHQFGWRWSTDTCRLSLGWWRKSIPAKHSAR